MSSSLGLDAFSLHLRDQLMREISELRLDESAIWESMAARSEGYLTEETIDEEDEEEESSSYEEVEVSTDGEEEVEIVEETLHSNPSEHALEFAFQPIVPPSIQENPIEDSGFIPMKTTLRAHTEEEKIEEELEDRGVQAQKSKERAKAIREIVGEASSSSSEEEEEERAEEQAEAQEQAPNNDEGSDDETLADFAPCLDVTDENEDELTERLYDAMHHALDAWDLHQFDLIAPRPVLAPQPPGSPTRESPTLSDARIESPTSAFHPLPEDEGVEVKEYTTNKTTSTTVASKATDDDNNITNNEAKTLPKTSDLHWAARKAADTIYPENYCIPPVASPEEDTQEVRENQQLEKGDREGGLKKHSKSLGDIEKVEPVADTDASTSASTNSANSVSSSFGDNDQVPNAEIFALRLQEYQHERDQERRRILDQGPQDDSDSSSDHSKEQEEEQAISRRPQEKEQEGEPSSNSSESQQQPTATIYDDAGLQEKDAKGEAPVVPPTEVQPREEETETSAGNVPKPKHPSDISRRGERKEARTETGLPQMEAWDDEEAQLLPQKQAAATTGVRNIPIPAKYENASVIYERELVIVPKKQTKTDTERRQERSRTLVRRFLLCLLVILPFSIGAYLALRK